MNAKLLALVPWMVLAGVGYGQVRSADVLFTHHEATPQPGYRVGDECFVALETLQLWGWKTDVTDDEASIEAEGHKFKLATRIVSNRTVIAFRKAIKELGGESDWETSTDTLSVYSNLTEVSVHDGKIHVAAPMAFKATPFFLKPDKTVIDLDGVRIGEKTKQDLPSGARIFQYRPNIVRLTLTTPYIPKLPAAQPKEDSTLDVDVTAPQDKSPPTKPITDDEEDNPQKDQQTTPPPTTSASILLTVSVETDTATQTELKIHLGPNSQVQAQVAKPDPDTIQITLPGVKIVEGDYAADTKAVESISAKAASNGAILTIKLPRPMGAEVISSGDGVSLVLIKPKVGNGHIAGKIIVVDPGHGGHDSGAHDGGYNEKDLTLSIGKQLAAKLASDGATVIMTRKTDVFIPLLTRSQISNDNHADFFISCHINSTGNSSRQSGTITFHHGGNKIGYLLAECIQHEIVKVNGLPNLGVWSDTRIYTTGFSVLRHTTTPPAVLIEMGFINNSKDRARMITDEFQDAVTTAIVKGVRVYLGDLKPNE